MDDAFLIPDEWLSDIRGIASREADGKDVTVSRKALKGILARLDVAERSLPALEKAKAQIAAMRAAIIQAVNQLPLSDGPMLEHFRGIHARMRLALLEGGGDGTDAVVCACGLETTLNCLAPGGSHYGHTKR